jgi:hypothetical protein
MLANTLLGTMVVNVNDYATPSCRSFRQLKVAQILQISQPTTSIDVSLIFIALFVKGLLPSVIILPGQEQYNNDKKNKITPN